MNRNKNVTNPENKDNKIQIPVSSYSDTEKAHLLKLATAKMPFGKYAGNLLIDLPEPYVVWFNRKGFPKGELGQMLSEIYEIKVNGLEYLFDPILKRTNGRETGNRQIKL